MAPNGFRGPRVPPLELRRRAVDDFITLLAELGNTALSRGDFLHWDNTSPSRTAYRQAAHRLSEAGVLASGTDEGQATLRLTEEGERCLPQMCRATFPWPRHRDGP